MGASLIIRETNTGKCSYLDISKDPDIEGYLMVSPIAGSDFIKPILDCKFPEYWDGGYDELSLEDYEEEIEPNFPDYDNPPPVFWFSCTHTARTYLHGLHHVIMDLLRYGEHTGKWKIEIEDIY
jgi:hypothetical protein